MSPRPLYPEEPERIGDYRLSGVLGEGGQGVVYLAEAPSGARVAIKVLHHREAMDAESRRRFLREADTARRVALFCTARVLDVGALHDRPYVVSEYIPGRSLAEVVAADGPRAGSGLHRLVVATLTALAAIHRAGVVHRDFKPGNVILGPEGPVVIDFGIARTVDHTTTAAGLVGTPAYLAPEQFIGQAPSGASDVFGWACTMTFAATGRPAFNGATIPALMFAITARDPDLSGVPDELRPLLAACLDKNPGARPTAADLLRSFTESDPHDAGRASSADTPTVTAVSPPGREPSTSIPSKSRRWLLGVAAGLTALLVTGVILVLQREAPASGTLLYSDDFGNRDNWDGYTFSPDAEGDNRTMRGYEIDRGVYSLMADKSYPSNASLSPVPAKNASTVERQVMIGVTAEVREGSTGRASFGLLCQWDEDVPNGYAFMLGLDGTARVIRTARGTNLDVTPPVPAEAPRAGQKVRIEAACRQADAGTRLTLWIDGTQTIDVVDSEQLPDGSAGQVGLVARAPEAGGGVVTVSFDDFSVHRPQ
ncbi:serine/threonine-protein kinase [Nonomuraea basaltis]|uniref:serine/threonine-protein kinase n=1 Tax=Nonomuraea basaltis TaxID=2495887 RepID=UPI0014865EAD|nr:serine/threonine-protein kinase [Nonomuraea basaltis]